MTPTVRMKKDDIVIKLGNESTTLSCREAGYLARTLQDRITESQLKQNRNEIAIEKVFENFRIETQEFFDELRTELDKLIAMCEDENEND